MKNSFTSVSVFIFIVLLLMPSESIFGQVSLSPIYQCAPCGCDSDGKHFHEPGNCPSCGMKLELVTAPRKALKKLDEPLNVAILLYHHTQVLDYAAPYDIFLAGGQNFNVYTVAETTNAVMTMSNLSVNPQYDFSNAPEADILIVPGGMWNVVNEQTKKWILKSSKQADYVLSVCTGAFILAELGLLNNLKATTHSAGVDLLRKQYPKIQQVYDNVRYVDNGKIITSGGVTAGMDASLYLISKVLGEEWVDAIKRNLEYQE